MGTAITSLEDNILSRRIRKATKKLRDSYYENHNYELLKRITAFGGSPKESIGPWPEYNLRGKKCPRSLSGYCSPCFYSRFPEIKDCEDNESIEKSLMTQIDQILDAFPQIIERQIGYGKFGQVKCNYTRLQFPSSVPIAICLTPVGSFFNDLEFNHSVRLYMLRELLKKSEVYKRDITLYVESHVEDFLQFMTDDTNKSEEIDLLKKLNLRIVFGFESKNNFIRNSLYNKALKLERFELAVQIAKENEFIPYAFVIAGLYPMNNLETIIDVTESLKYLKRKKVVPVLMFTNIQKYTIYDLLLKNNFNVLLEPRTILEIMKVALEMFPEVESAVCDSWLAADPIGGPPEPDAHIFDESIKCTCVKCSKIIYITMDELRKTHNYEKFIEVYNQLNDCTCSITYSTKLKNDAEAISLQKRTENMINYVEEQSDEYQKRLEIEEVLEIKAGILCHGINIADKECMNYLQGPPYFIKKGFIHSPNIMLGNFPVNACMNESFCSTSPYSIVNDGNIFTLQSNGSYIRNINFLELDSWCYDRINGLLIGDYLRPHSKECISIWPNLNCFFSSKCQFCSLCSNKKPTLGINTTVEMICHALKNNPNYEIALGGGIYKSFSSNIKYYSNIVKKVKSFYNTKFSLETIPPLSLEDLKTYRDSGVDSMIMNLEIYDERIRQYICPDKSRISKIHYFQAFKEGVNLFGIGNVSSVLIVGLQPAKDIINAAKEMTDIGVLPILMPFQPIDNTPLAKHHITNKNEYIDLTRNVYEMISTKSLLSFNQIGCTKCGACSLEKIVSEL